jgi:protein gp37
MAENSSIEWTDDTFNPWIGCTKVSPACLNCYAERDWDNRRHVAKWGPNGTRVVTSEGNWKKPIAWNRKAAEESTTRRVFCASLADVFESWQGPIVNSRGEQLFLNADNDLPATMGDMRRRLFRLIDSTPNLNWLLVTKRPENIRLFWPEFEVTPFDREDEPLTYRKNVWLLTSVENQEQADKRIPELTKCRDLAPVLGLSCEPLLGPLSLNLTGIDWVITGNESGPGDVRIGEIDWHRSIREQCESESVAFLFKQWGEWVPFSQIDSQWLASNDLDRYPAKSIGGHSYHRVGKKNAGRLLDGLTCDEFPK